MKTVDEIMALVDCHRRAYCGDYREYVITKTNDDLRSAIEAALKEREAPPKAQPMSSSEITEAWRNADCSSHMSELYAFKCGVFAAERHHGVGE